MSKKILVTGGTGYIGRAVAKALARSGYNVTALVRSPDKAHDLPLHEVSILQGDLQKVDELKDKLSQFSLIIDTVAEYYEKDPAASNRALVQAALAARPGLRTSYIYTSGILVYGDNPTRVVDEETPIGYAFTKWRESFEQWVFQQDHLDALVLRPGFVYGHSGSFSASFIPKGDETIVIKGNKDRRWSWVHLEDLAQAYVLAVDKFPIIKGQIFNVASEHAWSFDQIQRAVAQHVGFKGKIEYADVGDDFWAKFSNITVVISPHKARDLLGWQPRKLPFWDDLETYVSAIRAHQQQAQSSADASAASASTSTK